MGYVLLLIESLTLTLLLVATVLACTGRLARKWLRLGLSLTAVLAVWTAYAGLALAAGYFYFTGVSDRWFYPMLALTIAFAVGAVWLMRSALRRAEGELYRQAAATWPRGKLAIALGIAAALHAMTIWNMDVAARQQLGSLHVEAGAVALSVAPPRIPDRDNAALVYQRAFEAMGRYGDSNPAAPASWEWEQPWKDAWTEKWTKWDEDGEPTLDPRDRELRQFLARQSATLGLYRQAAAKHGCCFDRDYGRPSLAMLLPELLPIRDGARLLALDAICSAADGDGKRAIADISSMFGMAEHVRSESLMVSVLVSTVIDRLALNTMQIVLATAHVPAEELPAEWVSDDVSYRVLVRRALRSEEALRLATFAQVGEGQYTVGEIIGAAGGGGFDPQCGRSILALCYRVFLLADDLAAHVQFTENINGIANQPYWQAKDRLKRYEEQMHSRPGGLMTAVLMPSFSRAMQHVAVAEARRGAARLGLALYRYRARHGRFPEDLGGLVPEFIPALPCDPFDGKPLRLKRTGRGAVVYSVGPQVIGEHEGSLYDIDKKHRDISFTVPAAGSAKK